MPRSYRLLFVALAGLALSQAAYGQNEAARADAAGKQQAEIAKPESQLAPVTEAITEAGVKIESALRDPVTENGQTQTERDLKAQESMAFWAIVVAIASIITTAVSIYVAIIVKKTLKATADAAVHARTMAEEAQKATTAALDAAKAGRESNRIARDAQAAQLRPYVYLSGIETDIAHMLGMEIISNTGEIRIWFKNYGQTPAKRVTINRRCFYVNDPEDLEKPEWGEPEVLPDLPQGEKSPPIKFPLAGIAERHPALASGALAIVVDGQIAYQMGGKGGLYRTDFRFKLSGRSYVEKIAVMTRNGNAAI